MSTNSNPEITALWEKFEHLDKEIAEIRATLNRLTKIVRANIRQAVWQSIALGISIFIATVCALAYQTSVLNKRFEQIEKHWKESGERFAERSALSEKNIIARFEDLKQEVRAQRK
jgi:uncharacterized protein YabN with tetrapyrrole methylase and pyrophosphatase domain